MFNYCIRCRFGLILYKTVAIIIYMMKKYFSFSLFFMLLFIGTLYAQVNTTTLVKNNNQKVDNFDLKDAVKMYPNPVGNFLIVDSKIAITKVEIFSLLGSKVRAFKSNFRSIYLGDLKSGIYMIKIYSNNISTTKKLIKK